MEGLGKKLESLDALAANTNLELAECMDHGYMVWFPRGSRCTPLKRETLKDHPTAWLLGPTP